ncbi:MAG: glucosyltransferase domain-containing protein [Lachnospiraceae bacterium]|nr:glucosyltransferase domain-containing protein [Lachnospiraceae bacterium]
MKNIKLLRIHHYIIIFCMLVAIYCIYNYLGIPFDAFKKASTIDVLTSEQVICNGSSFEGNKYKIEASDHCIIISGDEYRTIEIDIETLPGGNASCIIYFAGDNQSFTDRYHKQYVLEEGMNKLVIPYRKDFSSVRIDIQGDVGTEFAFNSFNAVNRYSRLWMDLKIIVPLYIIIVGIVLLLINLKERKNKVLECDDKIYDYIFEPFKLFWGDLCDFVSKNKTTLFVLGVVALVAFGGQMFNYTLSIDEENATINPDEYVYVLSCGRFSLAFLLKLFQNSPFINTIFAAFFMYGASVLMLMVLRLYISVDDKILPGVICGSLFMCMPYVIGQSLNFSTFGVWIALGYVLSFFAVLLFSYTEKKETNHKWIFFLYSILLLTFTFGIYQSFLAVYVYMVVCLVYIFIKQLKSKEEIKRILFFIVKTVMIFAIAFVTYEIINVICEKYIISSSAYLESTFVGWNKWEPNSWVFYNVWENWSKLLNGTYFNLTAGEVVKYSVLAFIIYSFVSIALASRSNRIYMLIFTPFMVVMPFVIPLALGTFVMLGRSLEAFPIMLGIIWYLIFADLKELKVVYKMVGVFAVALVVVQLKHYNEFVYADQLRYQLDIEMASEVMMEIEKIEGHEGKAICFVGTYDFDNRYSLEHISGCESFFDFAGGDNNRILNFLNLSGYNVKHPSGEELQAAKNIAPTLPIWPHDGSVSDQGSYIIVNLSGY